MSLQYSTNELMAAAIAREIADGDLVFVGVGTAGRAYTLAVGLPIVATRLAQLGHAPDSTIYWGNLISPDLTTIPSSWLQDTFTRWPCGAQLLDTGFKLDMLSRGDFDVSFESAAQVDRYGNLNITRIGKGERPDVRLIGCLAQPEHLAFVKKPIILVDLSRRGFVEEVDYVTSFGHRRGDVVREKYQLKGPGPQLVISNLAVFDFKGRDCGMRLRSLHPGATMEQVLDLMGFRPEIPDHVPQTEPPTARQLQHIRQEIDPDRNLLRA